MIECQKCGSDSVKSAVDKQPKNKPHVGMFTCIDCGETFLVCPYCGEYPDRRNDKRDIPSTHERFLRCNNRSCRKEYSIGFYH